ncbi:methyltransferase domain-containing protein [Granulicella sp. S190]|uniref:methyltransferase domain-containing protein n=1 Tax=Granulicella sp. S190 TaxID=1747226 RepID=UPI00131B8FE0|nr:methyltransferase domain-containing protein [Granulicella sp. S190]
MTATATSSPEVFDTWSHVYDEQPNPLLMLEERFLSEMLPDLNGLHVLDAGCGTGRWLKLLASRHPASLLGVDSSTQMLDHAATKTGSNATLRLGTCTALPVQDGSIDLVVSSFVVSYLENLQNFAQEINRVTRPGASVFLADMHPETAITCNWTRSFKYNGTKEELQTNTYPLQKIETVFKSHGFELITRIEPHFETIEKKIFEENQKLELYKASHKLPAIYILQLQKKSLEEKVLDSNRSNPILNLTGARYALGPKAATTASLRIERGHIHSISSKPSTDGDPLPLSTTVVPLSGCLLLPGLINAHDHLEFGLFPNLGAGPYLNSAEWAKDIHRTHAAIISCHRRVPKSTRVWWGAIRNLLCGVTTVCHHNPLSRELLAPNFPIRVLSRFGWAHSLTMDPNLLHNFDHTPPNLPFVIHAAEGVDAASAQEIFDLDRMQILNDRTVLVHGLALDKKAVSLLNQRHSSLVICPTSNQFLFHHALSSTLIKSINAVVLGSDSPLTSSGDLLSEIAFSHNQIGLDESSLYAMVTSRSASVLRLRNGEGYLRPRSVADLVAVRDKGLSPAATVAQLTFDQIELVVLRGCVQLASDTIHESLPQSLRSGLEPLIIDGHRRWLRASVDDLLAQARKILGKDLRLGGKRVEHASAA